jgi:hypothetical protein
MNPAAAVCGLEGRRAEDATRVCRSTRAMRSLTINNMKRPACNRAFGVFVPRLDRDIAGDPIRNADPAAARGPRLSYNHGSVATVFYGYSCFGSGIDGNCRTR